MFDQIVDADWLELSKYANGDLLNRFNNDISTVSSNAVIWLPNIIVAVYNFIATFCVIFYYDSTMAWIALSSAPFLLIASRFLMRKNKEYRKRVLEINSGMMGFESETFYNMDTDHTASAIPDARLNSRKSCKVRLIFREFLKNE